MTNDYLITHATVVTMDDDRRTLYNGAIALDGERIAALGPTAELTERYPGAERINATGKVVLGMHIAPSGRVTRVGLRGPNPIVQGECGGCIRRAVKSIQYPSFDGPEMVAHYPIVFE